MNKTIRPTEIGKKLFNKELRNITTKNSLINTNQAIFSLRKIPNINIKQFSKSSLANSKEGNISRTTLRRIFLNNFSYYTALRIKEEYADYYAIWEPSVSKMRRYEHVLLYGKKFKVKDGIKGEFPCMSYGCKCGLTILKTNYWLLLVAAVGLTLALKEKKEKKELIELYNIKILQHDKIEVFFEYIILVDNNKVKNLSKKHFYKELTENNELQDSIIVNKDLFIDNKYVSIDTLLQLETMCEQQIDNPDAEIIKIGGIYL